MAVPLVPPSCCRGVGFGVGRSWAVAGPAFGLAVFYTGLNAGWWGAGVGDGWYLAMALLMTAATFGAALGVSVRRQLAARDASAVRYVGKRR